MRLAIVAATLLTAISAHPAKADDIDDLAAEAGVLVEDLQAAVDAQPGVDARDYLVFDGKIDPPPPPHRALSGRLACIAWHESRNDPNATNPRSKAAGLFQFLWSTWMTTPQGRAGLSPYDPNAATQAAQWMVDVGRIHEWSVVQMGYC